MAFSLLNVQDADAQTVTYEIKNCSITVQGSVYQSDEFCGEKKSNKQAIRTITKLPIGGFVLENHGSNGITLECKANSLCAAFTKVDGKSYSFLCTENNNALMINTLTVEKQNHLVKALKDAESSCASGSSVSQTNESQQRQARQMCEAQKQTCIASCPVWRSNLGNEHYPCKRSCESISCN